MSLTGVSKRASYLDAMWLVDPPTFQLEKRKTINTCFLDGHPVFTTEQGMGHVYGRDTNTGILIHNIY